MPEHEIDTAYERKHVKLHKKGFSRSAVLPDRWLKRHNIQDEVELLDVEEGILVRAYSGRVTESPSIEDDPNFASFLSYLADDAIKHPETLIDPDALLDRIDVLIAGVDPD